MIPLSNIHSLSDFQRNTSRHIKEMKESGLPEVLTVNGKAELVVQSAESYQALLDKIELHESARKIERSMQDFRAGKFLTLEEFDQEMDEFVKKTESGA